MIIPDGIGLEAVRYLLFFVLGLILGGLLVHRVMERRYLHVRRQIRRLVAALARPPSRARCRACVPVEVPE